MWAKLFGNIIKITKDIALTRSLLLLKFILGHILCFYNAKNIYNSRLPSVFEIIRDVYPSYLKSVFQNKNRTGKMVILFNEVVISDLEDL